MGIGNFVKNGNWEFSKIGNLGKSKFPIFENSQFPIIPKFPIPNKNRPLPITTFSSCNFFLPWENNPIFGKKSGCFFKVTFEKHPIWGCNFSLIFVWANNFFSWMKNYSDSSTWGNNFPSWQIKSWNFNISL